MAGRPQMCIYREIIQLLPWSRESKHGPDWTGAAFLIYTTQPQPSILFYTCLDQLHLHIQCLLSEYISFSFFPGNGTLTERSGKSEPGSGSEGKKWTEDTWQSRANCCNGPTWPSGTQEDQLLVWFTFARGQKSPPRNSRCTLIHTLLLRLAWTVGDDPGISALYQFSIWPSYQIPVVDSPGIAFW